MKNWAHRTSRPERAASATEYALLISGVSVMLIAIVVMFGDSLAGNLTSFIALF